MKGLDDPTPDPRQLRQDSISDYELTSEVYAGILTSDLGFANLKILASMQELWGCTQRWSNERFSL